MGWTKIAEKEISWKDEFDSSHFLYFNYPSKCRRVHGHSAEMIVMIKGFVNENGVVFDFNHLKEVSKELDHKTFIPERAIVDIRDGFVWAVTQNGGELKLPENEVIIVPYLNATSEFLSEYILDKLIERAGENVTYIKVCIKEDPRSEACSEAYRNYEDDEDIYE